MKIENDIESLLSDKTLFDRHVYTHWQEALDQLAARQNNTFLTNYLQSLHPHGLPSTANEGPFVAMFRNIASPNYEAYRFRIVADVMPALRPVFFEYSEDKFADINPSKRALGKLCFYRRRDRHGNPITHHRSILEMEHANGKKIHTLLTRDGNKFVDEHHRFLNSVFGNFFHIEDISAWLKNYGEHPKEYYLPFLSLFLKHGILLENFLFTPDEKDFSREIILPAIHHLEEMTGLKPLIVALEPTDIEGDMFWTSYPYQHVDFFTPAPPNG